MQFLGALSARSRHLNRSARSHHGDARRRSAVRIFAGRYAIAFMLATTLMAGSVVAVNYVIDTKLAHVSRVRITEAVASSQGANFLVIGSDTRAFATDAADQKAFGTAGAAGGQRSDTMMVVHVEPGVKRTLAVSFPRDMWVNIPGVGNSKINAAFNSGPNKVIETLKANFGVAINHYIQVDFKSFQGVVHAIGNVPVYFPYPARDDKTGLFIYQPGCVRLDGPGSLAYVRSRDLQYYSTMKSKWVSADAVPDINRIARQQDFIRRLAGLAVAKSLNDPLTANDITDQVLKNLKIDQGLSKQDIFSLVDVFRTINPDDQSAMRFVTFPWQDGANQGGQSVLYPRIDPSAVGPGWHTYADLLSDFTNHDSLSAPGVKPGDVKVRVLDGSSRGQATAALAALEKLGFRGAGSAADPRGSVATSEVRYRPAQSAKGRLALSYLDPAARLVEDSHLQGTDIAIVLGTDFHNIVAASPTAATTATPIAPASSAPAASPGPAPIADVNQFGAPAVRKPPC